MFPSIPFWSYPTHTHIYRTTQSSIPHTSIHLFVCFSFLCMYWLFCWDYSPFNSFPWEHSTSWAFCTYSHHHFIKSSKRDICFSLTLQKEYICTMEYNVNHFLIRCIHPHLDEVWKVQTISKEEEKLKHWRKILDDHT